MMDNMAIYEQAREVPSNAKKEIGAGRLKGFTDINPMWRIKRLTELFGPVGFGWWYEITEKRMVTEDNTHQIAAFVDVILYYVHPETGETSHGIPGTGGSTLVSQERNGAYMSDECYKMALTDAISVAAKAIGIGADVYFEKDCTKYSKAEDYVDVKMNTVADAAGYVLTFGKHSGQTLSEVYKTDLEYVDWLYDDKKTDHVIKQAIEILYKAAKRVRNSV